jgi:acyl-CoA thioester hydrolase
MSLHLHPVTDTRPQALYTHPVRVYWEDTDAGGIVFYANYLKFFERARTEWLRHRGVEQQALRDSTGVMFVVTQTQVRYRAPARLDDQLQVTVLLRHAGKASMQIAQQAWRGDVLLADGEVHIGCVAPVPGQADGTFRPCRIPPVLLNLLA